MTKRLVKLSFEKARGQNLDSDKNMKTFVNWLRDNDVKSLHHLLGYSLSLSVTISLSLLAVIVFAALFGTFVPLMLDKYKIDPALATGPFITTVNDILGLFIYFLIGQAIL